MNNFYFSLLAQRQNSNDGPYRLEGFNVRGIYLLPYLSDTNNFTFNSNGLQVFAAVANSIFSLDIDGEAWDITRIDDTSDSQAIMPSFFQGVISVIFNHEGTFMHMLTVTGLLVQWSLSEGFNLESDRSIVGASNLGILNATDMKWADNGSILLLATSDGLKSLRASPPYGFGEGDISVELETNISATCVAINPMGDIMMVANGNVFTEYALTTPFMINTAVQTNQGQPYGNIQHSIVAMTYNSDGTQLFGMREDGVLLELFK